MVHGTTSLKLLIQLASLLFTVGRILLCTLTLRNTTAFLTRLVQLISIILHHHISKPSKYFGSTVFYKQSLRINSSQIECAIWSVSPPDKDSEVCNYCYYSPL